MEVHRNLSNSSSLTVLWVLLLSTFIVMATASRVSFQRDPDDEYRQHQQPNVAYEELDHAGIKQEPADAEWFDLQALKHVSAAAPASPPEKRHLCRAKYVYNPVTGRCQPSLSALRGQGR